MSNAWTIYSGRKGQIKNKNNVSQLNELLECEICIACLVVVVSVETQVDVYSDKYFG